MSTEQPWTIGRLLDWTAGFLKQKGSESPRLDSEVLLAHVLGFVGTEEQGLEGLEHKLDSVLSGKPGQRKVLVGPDGTVINELVRVKPQGYNDVTLTIDHVIQHYLERELDKAYALYSPKNCFAAAMDPNTGEILAMAVRPTFDPNSFSTAAT